MADDSIGGLLAALQGAFAADGGAGLRRLLELLAGRAMAEEVTAHVGAGPHERAEGRRGHRNGHKPRTLKTRVGELELSVPRLD